MVSKTQVSQSEKDGSSLSLSRTEIMQMRERRQRIMLIIFASISTFFYAGGFYGWGPMQLLLEENGNFASRCSHESDIIGRSSNTTEDTYVCTEQTEAFLTCKFVSQLTLLSGTVWGIFSDRYGNKVLTRGFGFCNIAGLLLLIVGIRFPIPWVEDVCLYAAFILIGLASTVGGMLTVETGLLFKHDQKKQNRVISFLNALFDAGAMAYLGLWGIEKLASSSSNATSIENKPNEILILIIVGFLCLALVCIGGYTHFFHIIRRKNLDDGDENRNQTGASNIDNGDEEKGKADRRDTTNETLVLSSIEDDEEKEAAQPSPSHSNLYVPIAMRAPSDQMTSRAYILLGIWFSFHSTSNHWTLTTARDFLGELGDDDYGNRYLTIFTMLTPFSIIALPFLDAVINKFGFHSALQAVNILGILHGIIKVWVPSLDFQIFGFVVFTFFRCFLYSVGLTCAASFIGPNAIGKATGTLYVLAGVTSFFNIGLAHWAMEEESFFLPNLIYLVGTIPIVYVTYDLGQALKKDQVSKETELTNSD